MCLYLAMLMICPLMRGQFTVLEMATKEEWNGKGAHKPEDLIGTLRKAEIVLAQGGTVADACSVKRQRLHGQPPATLRSSCGQSRRWN